MYQFYPAQNLLKITKTTGFQPKIPHFPLASYIFIKNALYYGFSGTSYAKISGKLYEKGHYCSKTVFLFSFLVSDYRRQEGNGRVGLGIDHYLLDNRNRTQKWDE